MNEFVLNGLVKCRAELAGDIERMHETLTTMVLDLESLDATILQFDPDYRIESIKAKAFRPPKDLEQSGPDVPDRAQHPSPSRRATYQPRYCLRASGGAGVGQERSATFAAHDKADWSRATDSEGKRPCSVRTGAGQYMLWGITR